MPIREWRSRLMIQALVRGRMRLGVSKTRARVELAYDLGATEPSIRHWEAGRNTPHPLFRRAIQRLYDKETLG